MIHNITIIVNDLHEDIITDDVLNYVNKTLDEVVVIFLIGDNINVAEVYTIRTITVRIKEDVALTEVNVRDITLETVDEILCHDFNTIIISHAEVLNIWNIVDVVPNNTLQNVIHFTLCLVPILNILLNNVVINNDYINIIVVVTTNSLLFI